MKYLVLLGDGMADEPIATIGGKTPLEAANKPNIDRLCRAGETGTVKTVPDGMKPGSDVANLSVMGYPPDRYYTGRSPLEALSIGVKLEESDVAVRTNLVTLSDAEPLSEKVMLDYSAGEITTGEARELVLAAERALGAESVRFYPGVSYRHCMVVKDGLLSAELTPPHDISDKKIGAYLPKGEGAALYRSLIEKSGRVFKNHTVNLARIARGLRPATHIWLWGAGSKPSLPSFYARFGLKGAVVSAVDLLKGIAIAAGMEVLNVEGATGTLQTNYRGKAEAAIDAFRRGADYVYVHLEAPDECGHQGDLTGKIAAIETVDKTLGILEEGLKSLGEPYSILVTPDHATPLAKKTHVADPVPFVLYRSGENRVSGLDYSEANGRKGTSFPSGEALARYFLNR